MKWQLWTPMLLMFTSCGHATQNKKPDPGTLHHPMVPQAKELRTAYFAEGCFWCVEAIFESVRGVDHVVSGYSGGTEENPTYEQVGQGLTGHAESVAIYYDPNLISFDQLVAMFFGSHDPTTKDRQGPDRGRQYRSIAFYQNQEEKKIIEGKIAEMERANIFQGKPITTEVTAFTVFYPAEEYHQDYERNHPDNPYVQQVSVPRLNRFKEKFRNYLKDPKGH